MESVIVIIGTSGHARDIAATVDSETLLRDWYPGDPWVHVQPYMIGINDPHIRAEVAHALPSSNAVNQNRWVHPTAYLGIETVIGGGTHVNYRVSMTRCQIGRFATISPGAILSGDVTIGDRVLIGAGANIAVSRPGAHITIGDDVTIGAGAVVLHDLTEGTWVGVPARRIK